MSDASDSEAEARVRNLGSAARRAFTEEEVRLIKAYLDDPGRREDSKAWRDRILFFLGVLTGYRGHEISRMRWEACYNFKRGCLRQSIHVPRRYMKGARKTRTIWMPDQLRSELALWLPRYEQIYGHKPHRKDYVLSNVRKGKGRRMSPAHMYRVIHDDLYCRACVGEGFDDTLIGVHSMRKYAVNKRYSLTGSAADACRYAGHAQPDTTMRYISNISREQEEELARNMHI